MIKYKISWIKLFQIKKKQNKNKIKLKIKQNKRIKKCKKTDHKFLTSKVNLQKMIIKYNSKRNLLAEWKMSVVIWMEMK